jgi:hypothetical protein
MAPQEFRRAGRGEDVHVWTLDGGKAVTFQQHIDTVRVRELM